MKIFHQRQSLMVLLLALNSELLELIIAHGAQLRDATFVHVCRCTCRQLREATAPWVSFYAEKRAVEWGRLFAGPKQLRVRVGELERWAERDAFSGFLHGLDLSGNGLLPQHAGVLWQACCLPWARWQRCISTTTTLALRVLLRSLLPSLPVARWQS